MEFGWKLHTLNLLLYMIFLLALNIYAFEIPSYKETQENSGKNYTMPELSVCERVTMVTKIRCCDVTTAA